jgi:NAD(P)-dependent dehydrogenase (short-subunit alcohol dehydrogenase family)
MPTDAFDLSGKRALIAGPGGVIEDAIAAALQAAGATTYRASAVSDELVDEAAIHLGGLDTLVTGGDLKLAAPLVELDDADLDRVVATNLVAPLRLIRAVGRAMLGRGGGRIIVVHSILAERGVPNTSAYSATQAALAQLIRALAIEWARSDIRINGIALGWFKGDPFVAAAEAERLARFLPSRRLGRPEDVGALAVYLASDAADMMTGRSIVVDGGAMIHA